MRNSKIIKIGYLLSGLFLLVSILSRFISLFYSKFNYTNDLAAIGFLLLLITRIYEGAQKKE